MLKTAGEIKMRVEFSAPVMYITCIKNVII